MLTTLIVTFNCPALSFVEETKQEYHIHNAYEVLRPWNHLPLIRRGLDQARVLMQQAGLTEHTSNCPIIPSDILNTALKGFDWYSLQSSPNHDVRTDLV